MNEEKILEKDRNLKKGDVVKHFKRETININEKYNYKYLYVIREVATHTETNEKLVIYQALYAPYEMFARPYESFIGKVDKEKYPNIKQEYRFEGKTF